MSTFSKTQIREVFNNKFNKEKFKNFILNLLNDIDNNSSFTPLRGQYIKAPFRSGIHEYERVCKYKDSFSNEMDVLIVKLTDKNKLENARTFQRNFVVDYISEKMRDGALVAFYSDDSDDWRFSFVKLEYELKEEEGKVLEQKIMTSAKRYSFLVGKNENSHTAQSQLLPLLEDETNNPTLKQIEKAFEVETVTKEFFEKYKCLFDKVKTELDIIVDKDEILRKDFEDKEINTVDFAKKLLGQIVFLYFLQKKGWFGVERGKEWGSGSKKFLRDLYERKVIKYDNFFNDILEPLFYQTLANDRTHDDHFSSHFNCRIPFLNGGLFDPICDYDWIGTDIIIPNELFSNSYISDDKHKDVGTGILDVFDRYNFTVREDEPLEKEVAIDPEMLGKVFENMLEVKDRKSKGTYYTPREIVHYMCQESLINYLETNLENKVNRDDLAHLVKKAQFETEKEKAAMAGVKKYEEFISDTIQENATSIDNLLANIKVCDPAIGSGAFPVGMMNEIVKARSNVSQYISDKKDRTEYEFKRHAIANSLYGVDLDPGAVEIAKLRLWLSLIVDEDDIRNIKPLPNLDYKIMQGNSLIEEYEGIKLFDDNLLKIDDSKEKEIEKLKENQRKLQKQFFEVYQNKETKLEAERINEELNKIKKNLDNLKKQPKENESTDMFASKDEVREKAEKLKKLQKQFFETSEKGKKRDLKDEIDDLIWDLIETTVKHEGKIDKLEHIKKIRKSNNKPFFLWKLNFADVFQEKGGFDVVIGNPPYVGHKGGIKETFKIIKNTELGRNFNNERMDLFYYFFHFSVNNAKENGVITFITTNYYLTADGAVKLRTDFKNRCNIRILFNFSEYKIFDSARGQHSLITLIQKCSKKDQYKCNVSSVNKIGVANNNTLTNILENNDKETKLQSVLQSELYESEYNYIRILLKGSKFENVLNNILYKIRIKSILVNDICDISQGIVTGCDKITKKHISIDSNVLAGSGIYIVSKDELDIIGDSNLIKPWFKNSDIHKYKTNNLSYHWVIKISSQENIFDYINIKNHLDKYKRFITMRNYDSGELSKAKRKGAWWALSSARSEFDFSQAKIVAPQRSNSNTFGYNEIPWYASADVYFITQKDKNYSLKYILASLNSKLYYIWLYYKGKRKGDSLELYQKPLSEIPIRIADENVQQPFIQKVDQILSITQTEDYLTNDSKKSQVKLLEKEIDQMVYKLYDLTDEEIIIVEDVVNTVKNENRTVRFKERA
ncbi:MAG: DNA methyltransferase, partial [bacterium]